MWVSPAHGAAACTAPDRTKTGGSGQPPSARGKRGGPGQQEHGEGSVISLCVFLALGVLFLNYFLVWLCWVLPVTLGIFSFDMWDLIP